MPSSLTASLIFSVKHIHCFKSDPGKLCIKLCRGLFWLKSCHIQAALIDWAIPNGIPSTIADTARYEIHFCMSTAWSIFMVY